MKTFEIEIQRDSNPQILQVIRKSSKPNAQGYIPFEVRAGGDISVVCIDPDCLRPRLIYTEQDAWNYLEALLYPEPDRVYCEEYFITGEELELIRIEIAKYFMQ